MTKWMLSLLASSALVPIAATAQTTAPADAATQPAVKVDGPSGEIVVTAQRYEQRLQDVPISITAVTGAELQARNVTDIGQLQYSIPGFSTYRYGPGQEFYQLQGVSNDLGSSTIGLYLDETPLALNQQGNGLSIQLLDLERVEVLRGPQATLYGEGSMGGTIRYIPATPKLDSLSGSIEGEVNSVDGGGVGYRTTAVANIPIIEDKLAIRLVAGYQRDAGWIDSSVTGKNNVNPTDTLTLRGTILAKPTDRLTVTLMGLHSNIQQDYGNFGFNDKTSAALPTATEDNYTLVEGKFVYALDFADLTGIGSYIHRNESITADLTPFYLPYLSLFGISTGTITQIGDVNQYDYNVYSGEIRLTSHNQGPFGWVLGASYRDLKLGLTSFATTAPGTAPFTILAEGEKFETKTYAVYGEVHYAISDKLIGTGGLRYYKEDLTQDTSLTSFGATSVDTNAGSFHSVNPRFNISYNFTKNSMIYADVAKGFRGGGFNLASSGGGVYAVPPTYNPDHIWTYEVGTKHQLFDGRLTLDGSVYHSDWSDVQSYGFAPGSPIVIVSNSGHVKGWGVDLSAAVRPVRGLTLTGTYGWNNLAFDTATSDKNIGDPVDGAVRQSYSASGEYRVPLSENTQAFFRVDYQHSGPAQITLRNFAELIRRPSRDLVNLRLGTDIGKLELSVFASNVLNNRNPIIVGPFGVYAENLEQTPRVIGLNGRFNF